MDFPVSYWAENIQLLELAAHARHRTTHDPTLLFDAGSQADSTLLGIRRVMSVLTRRTSSLS